MSSDPEDVVRAMNITLQNSPSDPARFFRSCIRKKANIIQEDEDKALASIIVPDAEDPFQD